MKFEGHYAQRSSITLVHHHMKLRGSLISGMRMGEVYSLQWDQVSWPKHKLFLHAHVTKTKEPRVLYLTGDLVRVLEAWQDRSGCVAGLSVDLPSGRAAPAESQTCMALSLSTSRLGPIGC